MARDHDPEKQRRILLDIVGNALLHYWSDRERDPSSETRDPFCGDVRSDEQVPAA
jgi:hypothetical protein